jgi:hypothetical protein
MYGEAEMTSKGTGKQLKPSLRWVAIVTAVEWLETGAELSVSLPIILFGFQRHASISCYKIGRQCGTSMELSPIIFIKHKIMAKWRNKQMYYHSEILGSGLCPSPEILRTIKVSKTGSISVLKSREEDIYFVRSIRKR